MSIKTYTRSHTPATDYETDGALHGFNPDGDVDYASDRAAALYDALGVPLDARDAGEETLGALPDGRWALVGLDVEGHAFAVEREAPAYDGSHVEISNDPTTIGETATRADLEGYAANLEAELAQRFGKTIQVRLRSRWGVAGDHDQAVEYVRELQRGDGWTAFVPSSVS